MQELGIARADGSYPALIAKLARVHVLVIDDFLIAPMTDVEKRDLLECLHHGVVDQDTGGPTLQPQ